MQQVSKAIAARYGLPLDAIIQRITAGRFRVKANVDLPTATKFATDLESLGAVCSVVEASAAGSAAQARADQSSVPVGALPTAPPLMQSSAGMALPQSGGGTIQASSPPAPQTGGGPGSGALSGAAAAPSSFQPEESGEYQSGLAAAFGGSGQSDLGALSEESGSFALSSLDGKVDPPPPDPEPVAASAVTEPGAAESNDMVDLFAPPDAQKEVVLAVDLPVRNTPPPMAAVSAEGVGAAAGFSATGEPLAAPMLEPAPEPESNRASEPALQRATSALARDERLRLAVGVLIALIVGFIPAHVIGAIREGKYDTIDKEVKAEYAVFDKDPTVENWQDLEPMVDEQKKLKTSTRDNIAVTGLIVWVGFGGLVGFLWMRKVPWDRWE